MRQVWDKKPPTENWDREIVELEAFFDGIELPKTPIKLSTAETIFYVERFVKTHLEVVKANNGKRWYRPYLNRLIELKEILENVT